MVQADEEESAIGERADARIGNVRVFVEGVEDERDSISFTVDRAVADALVGTVPQAPLGDLADLVDGAYPLPSERVYEAIEEAADAACLRDDYEDDECSAERRCHDRAAIVEDPATHTILNVHGLASSCGDLHDEYGTVAVQARDVPGSRAVFVIVWDDTEEDPSGRCGCNPEARIVHVVVLDAEGALIAREEAGYTISTCGLGESDGYNVVWRDVDADGTKELVGEIVTTFEPPEEETYGPSDEEADEEEEEEEEEEAGPPTRPWFTLELGVQPEASSAALAPLWCAPATRAAPQPQPTPPTRSVSPAVTARPNAQRRPAGAIRQALHENALECECGVDDACLELAELFRGLRKNAWAEIAERRAVNARLEACIGQSPERCLDSLRPRSFPTVPRARLRAALALACADADGAACITVAEMDLEDGVHVREAEAMLSLACEEGSSRHACDLIVSRGTPASIVALRVLCSFGEIGACFESAAHARSTGRELDLRELVYSVTCP